MNAHCTLLQYSYMLHAALSAAQPTTSKHRKTTEPLSVCHIPNINIKTKIRSRYTTATFLLFLPVLALLLPLQPSVYLCLKTGILFRFTYVHLTVLLLLNLILNLTSSPLLIMSSHRHASASDSFINYWHYINVFD